MRQTYAQCSLFLYPDISDFVSEDSSAFIAALQQINFISQAVDNTETHHYFTGNKFLDYIAYMGCAPAIQFEENENNHFCFVKILNFTSATLIHSQQQARVPHCPECQKSVNNWQNSITSTTLQCHHCGTSSNIGTYNWRKMAGYAKLFIEITDIFPKEAMPQKILLDKLAGMTGVEWSYFYSCK